jgi:hypothetical protein
VRRLAIRRLFIFSLAKSVERIVVGRRYGVVEWLLDAYVAVCTREEGLTVDEGTALGMQEAMNVCAIREAFARGKFAPGDVRDAIRRACCPEVPAAVGEGNGSARTPDASPRTGRTGLPVCGAPSLPDPAAPLRASSEKSPAVANSFAGRRTGTEMSASPRSGTSGDFGTIAATLSGAVPCPATPTDDTSTSDIEITRRSRAKPRNRDVGRKSVTGNRPKKRLRIQSD